MWNLFRILPEGKTYEEIVSDFPEAKFDYKISTEETEIGCQRLESVIDWDTYWSDNIEKYGVCRSEVKRRVLSSGWDTLSSSEKMIAIKYREYPSPEVAIPFLIGEGMSLSEAKWHLIKTGAEEQEKLIGACKYRGSSKILFMIIGKYLSIQDQADLNELVDAYLNKFMFRGLRGTTDGKDGNIGLFDFIEKTGV